MENQILINRDQFSRLVERYLLAEILILQLRNSAPGISVEQGIVGCRRAKEY
jgi:hypothetical protein